MVRHIDDKPKSKCKPPKDGPMPPRWLNVIGSMIHGGMDFQAAMAESGYSAGYYKSNGHLIKQDARFCKAYQEELAKSKAKEEPRRARRMRDLDNIIEDPATLQRDRIAAIQLQGRMNGWLSETIRHESAERQVLLDKARAEEAAKLASILLDTRRLPDVAGRKQVDSVISDTIQDTDDTESATSQGTNNSDPQDGES